MARDEVENASTTEGLPVSPSMGPALELTGVPPRSSLVDARVVYLCFISIGLALLAAVIAEVLVLHERLIPMQRSLSVLVLHEDPAQPPAELACDVIEGHELARSGRALDLEVVAVVVVKLLQRLDQQIVRGKPDRSAPVRVAAE